MPCLETREVPAPGLSTAKPRYATAPRLNPQGAGFFLAARDPSSRYTSFAERAPPRARRAIAMARPRLLMRGLANVRAEFSLTALAYNLRRALNILGFEAVPPEEGHAA